MFQFLFPINIFRVWKMEQKRDINGLCRAAKYKKDARVQLEAIKALGEFRDLRGIKPLSEALSDDNEDLCIKAIDGLKNIGGLLAIEALSNTIRNRKELAYRAIYAIGEIGQKESVPVLLEVINDPNQRDSLKIAISALAKISPMQAEEVLFIALKKSIKSSYLHNRLLEDAPALFLATQSTRGFEHLIKHDPDRLVSWEKVIPGLAAAIGDSAAEEILLKIMRVHKRVATRLLAADTLSKLGLVPKMQADLIVYLIASLPAGNPRTIKKIVSLGDDAIIYLIDSVFDFDEHLGGWGDPSLSYAKALLEIGDLSIQPLLKTLRRLFESSKDQLIETRASTAHDPKPFPHNLKLALHQQAICVLMLTRLGQKEAAGLILDWLFEFPDFFHGWLETEYTNFGAILPKSDKYWNLFNPLFEQYSELIWHACSVRYEIDYDGGELGQDSLVSVRLDNCLRSIKILCNTNTKLASNLLLKISNKKQIYTSGDMYIYFKFMERNEKEMINFMNSSYLEHRKQVLEELERRGNPAYDPSIYLEDGAWSSLPQA